MDCKICSKVFKSLNGLHKHLHVHNTSIAEYYYKHFPRYDKGNPSDYIIYKNYNQYFTSNFNSRESFILWAAENEDIEEVKDYCLKEILLRKERKSLVYIPTQVELKSLMLPSYFGLKKIFGSIENFTKECESLGLKRKFDYKTDFQLSDLPDSIFIDTREQKPLDLPVDTKIMKLPVGDYCPSTNIFDNVFIERKSVADLFGTLTNGIERFEREIAKAAELDLYLVVLVDGSYAETMDFSSNYGYKGKTNGKHIFHEIRDLMFKYDNIQFVFAGSRYRASELMLKIFQLRNQVRTLDLEFLKDLKLI